MTRGKLGTGIVAASLLASVAGCAQLEKWWCGEPLPPPTAAPDPRYDAEVRALDDEIARYQEALAAGACSERSFELVLEPLAVPDIRLRPNTARTEAMRIGTLLERSTVLVLGPKGLRATGFFVGPRDVVTVVEAAAIAPEDVMLLAWASEHVPARAKLVKSAGPDGVALLHLEEGESPGIPLAVGPPPAARSTVVAAAVTGGVDYAAMNAARGSGKRIGGEFLTLALNRGETMRVQGDYDLVHTAALVADGSGGPLVDACGRVFGVAVRAAPKGVRVQRYAVLAAAVRGALAEVHAVSEDDPCVQSTVPNSVPTPARVEIPHDAIAVNDVSFLAGHWRMYQRDASGTFSPDFEAMIGGKSQPGVKVQESLHFDFRGNGEREILLSDGRVCRAPASARVEGGKLVIRADRCQAPSLGLNWVGSTITCEPAGSGEPAKCTSTQDEAQPLEVWLTRVAQAPTRP